MNLLRCSRCREMKPESEFAADNSRHGKSRNYRGGWCLPCRREYTREYEAKRRIRLRDEVYGHYGKKCRCCGESRMLFLTIDHINGNGNAHRRAIGVGSGASNFYFWIIKNGFPDDLQPLCFNCNMGRQINKGVCPHEVDDPDWVVAVESAVRSRNYARGEGTLNSKLTDADVLEIRRRRDAGETVVSIAKDFPVTTGIIARVSRRAAWTHVPEASGPPPVDDGF